MKKRETINERIARARKYPLAQTFGGTTYYFYDESRDEGQAKTWAEQLRRRNYRTYIDPRLIEDIKADRFWTDYDVFFAKTDEAQP
jgi:hypothetical protein